MKTESISILIIHKKFIIVVSQAFPVFGCMNNLIKFKLISTQNRKVSLPLKHYNSKDPALHKQKKTLLI